MYFIYKVNKTMNFEIMGTENLRKLKKKICKCLGREHSSAHSCEEGLGPGTRGVAQVQ